MTLEVHTEPITVPLCLAAVILGDRQVGLREDMGFGFAEVGRMRD